MIAPACPGAYFLIAEFGAPISEMKPEEFAEYGIALEDLIANKKASGRAKDLADVEVLEGCRK